MSLWTTMSRADYEVLRIDRVLAIEEHGGVHEQQGSESTYF